MKAGEFGEISAVDRVGALKPFKVKCHLSSCDRCEGECSKPDTHMVAEWWYSAAGMACLYDHVVPGVSSGGSKCCCRCRGRSVVIVLTEDEAWRLMHEQLSNDSAAVLHHAAGRQQWVVVKLQRLWWWW